MPADMPMIRPARVDDAAALVPLVYASGSAVFDYVFGAARRPAVAFLRYALASGEGLLGWRAHHVAEQDGEVIASLALYAGDDAARLSRATIAQYFRFHWPWTAVGVLRRAMRIGEMQPPPDARDLYIAHLAVADGWRRRGVASRLLAYAQRIAALHDCERSVLDVADGNAAARRLYERHGFFPASMPRRPPDTRVPASLRMQRAAPI